VEHDEERRAVLIHLRPLVAVLRVFDGQLVKGKLLLQRREFSRLGSLSATQTKQSRLARCDRTSVRGMSESFCPRS
jgi:hypothetical protein